MEIFVMLFIVAIFLIAPMILPLLFGAVIGGGILLAVVGIVIYSIFVNKS